MPSGVYQHKHHQGFQKGHGKGKPTWMKGKHHSDEAKRKMSEANKGKYPSEETRRKLSEIRLGKKLPPFSDEHRRKLSESHKGKHLSEEARRKVGESNKGEKCHFWKGGVCPINKKIRSSLEYKLWREAVFKRDDYTCIWCGQRGVVLNADHIKPFSLFPELRFALDNGRTLCVECHKTTNTYAGKGRRKLQSV